MSWRLGNGAERSERERELGLFGDPVSGRPVERSQQGKPCDVQWGDWGVDSGTSLVSYCSFSLSLSLSLSPSAVCCPQMISKLEI